MNTARLTPGLRSIGLRLLRHLHHLDFAYALPWLARLPLPLGYALAHARGRLRAWLGCDWRSMALGGRHVRAQALAGLRALSLPVDEDTLRRWRDQRFITEARDEFEARLVAAGRAEALVCRFERVDDSGGSLCHHGPQPRQGRGLLLLTPHWESFYLGILFVARSAGRVHAMASAIVRDPRVDPAVQKHFDAKYRGLERYLNGGRVLEIEAGLRAFYRALGAGETLVVLGDAPALPQGVAASVPFLGARRRLAGGALRMAQTLDADLAAYVCTMEGPGRYVLRWSTPLPAREPNAIEAAYALMSKAILARPGGWFASDLLPHMTIVDLEEAHAPHLAA